MGRRVAGSFDIQTKKHMRGTPPADQAGTSSSFVKPRKSRTRGVIQQPPPPAPATSIDSILGSWSTLSAPKSILRQSAGTGSSQVQALPPPGPTTLSSRLQDHSSSKSTQKRRRTSAELPHQPQASTSRLSLGPRRSSSPSPIPVALRSLVPEPAPPPVGSTDRISSKQISNSSRDRPPPLNRVRRISTPYPHPGARATSKQPPPRPRRRMTKKSDAPYTTPPKWTPAPQAAAAQYLQSLAMNMPIVQSLVPRRASPVPPSSSKSDSSRSSSESYVSLNDDQPQDTRASHSNFSLSH